jgi:hypothetical protein
MSLVGAVTGSLLALVSGAWCACACACVCVCVFWGGGVVLGCRRAERGEGGVSLWRRSRQSSTHTASPPHTPRSLCVQPAHSKTHTSKHTPQNTRTHTHTTHARTHTHTHTRTRPGNRLGRRSELLLAAGLYGGGALLLGVAPSLTVLLLARVMYGLGIGFAMHAGARVGACVVRVGSGVSCVMVQRAAVARARRAAPCLHALAAHAAACAVVCVCCQRAGNAR